MDGSVLALIWNRRVLLVRKKCPSNSPWACDVALPGGRIKPGESIVDAALREAWEEAYIRPSLVKVDGILGVFKTMSGGVRVHVVLGRQRGPLDPRPWDREVDAVFWIHLDMIGSPSPVTHPVRGIVYGILLPGGLVLWGVTYRILKYIKDHYGLAGNAIQ